MSYMRDFVPITNPDASRADLRLADQKCRFSELQICSGPRGFWGQQATVIR